MRLLTHNFLCCLECQSFPLRVRAAEVEVLSSEFNAAFIRLMLARVDYTYLVEAFRDMQQEEGLVAALPGNLEDVDLSDQSEDLKLIHHAMLEVAVRQGSLVCSQCQHEYPIREFIPDMVLAVQSPLQLIEEEMMYRNRLREATLLDRVHEHVVLPPILLQAVDTTAFQRLRSLKQLGASSFVYPGAVHTRFEHSIGVAHLAQGFLVNIRRCQPELGITDDDIQKVMFAGLLHDVGHGPFSHLFEDVMKRCGVLFDHEEMSARIARRVLQRLTTPDGVEDVITIMNGCCTPDLKYGELVSNKRNGIDVDKVDYFLRDSLCCFGKPTIDVHSSRLFNSARLVCHGGEWQLAFEEKLAFTLRELLTLRARLHKNVYQHPAVKAVGHMIGDALQAAAPYFKVGGSTLLECAADDVLLLRLGDWVLEAIESSVDAKLQPAQDIIARLRARDIYRIVFSRSISVNVTLDPEWLQRLSSDILACVSSVVRPIVTAADFIADLVVINHGKGQSDPLQSVLFFNPKRPLQPASQMSSDSLRSPLFTPFAFEERTLMVFERRNTNGAIRTACERLATDEKYRHVFVDSLSFYNPS